MTKQRSNYLYELVGIIRESKAKKLRSQRECFNLTVELTNYPEISIIQTFKDKLKNQQIWTDLTNKKFIDKKYLFYCQNYYGNYHLVDWKKLTNHGND